MTTAGRARGLAIVLLAAGILATGALVPGAPAAHASSARPLAAQALATRTPSAPKLAPHVASRPHHVEALGGDLVDAVTGKRLWSRGLDQQRPMGSITKVMTALLVIRAGHLRRHIKITKAIPAYIRRHPGTSSAGLRAGDVLTVRQLLDAMLLPSGCDAALALARAYGPGRAAFVQKMNAAARKLGMRRTHFSNFDGLPLPTEHSTYSTPRNLITLGRAAMKLAAFRRIVDQQSHRLSKNAAHHAYSWPNTNLLLGSYPGVVGIKTGHTNAAGYCLLFEASFGGRTLIGVVLHSSGTNPITRFTAATRLLNWGFGTSVAPPRRPAGPVRD
jgi:D-alanyl-D-alanine carboxypeptidase (penicillin-binding protein 5/6)